jgi:hypothetical protein
MGAAVIYALKAPLSVDWGSLYSPQAGGAYMHSLVLPEGAIGRPWAADNVPLNAGTMVWRSAAGETLEVLRASSRMVGRMETGAGGTWWRDIRNIHLNEAQPVVVIHDRFSGGDIVGGKVMTLNMMSEPEVQTPRGPVTPPQRVWDNSTRRELPSATTPLFLASGLNKFGFRGQFGVDWDLYAVSGESQQISLGNWAHAWHPGREMAEFSRTWGRPFQERQNIFRLWGNGPFYTVLVPRRAGSAALAAAYNGSTLTFTGSNQRWDLWDGGHAYQGNGLLSVTAFGTGTVSSGGIEIRGGTAEVTVTATEARITAHGAVGIRTIKLPRYFAPRSPLTYSSGVYSFDYRGGNPVTVVLN